MNKNKMEIFQCKYLNHENEGIIGFCIHQNCQKATQYCYQCLTQNHSDHLQDCIRFENMSEQINQFVQVYKEQKSQIKEIIFQIKNCFEEIQKYLEQEISKLEILNQKLQNKEYLSFKSQLILVKQFYSKEKENKIQQQIIEFNSILETIKKMEQIQNTMKNGLNIQHKNKIQIYEIDDKCLEQKSQKRNEAKILFEQGKKLVKNHQYEEALMIFDNLIISFDQDDQVYGWKGFVLDNLNKQQEAIECYEKALLINPLDDIAWNNKGLALIYLNKYQEAIECCLKVLSINPNDDCAWNNKGNKQKKTL
ncbi:unnamed protein product [Paramecium octaurelia]|uniref:Tetratricopeptide repeat protein n=1 Tax=Paramecium octaurelia TaxID=43137 RepID=A0A8S1WY73_PAROT|nr:unnamed protein product [Paramecium octaurelia]